MGNTKIARKQMGILCLLCCLVYFVGYLTRLNYAVCMVEIQTTLGIGKNIAGLPLTASFLMFIFISISLHNELKKVHTPAGYEP